MKPLSIETVFLWTQRFVAREWRLLLPVAFAFLALPPLVKDLLAPNSWDALTAAAKTDNPALVLAAMQVALPFMLVVLLINAIGGLTITALALVPTISVREALTLAAKRFGILIASLLLIVLAEAFVAVLVGILFGALHLVNPGAQAVLLGVVMGLALYVGIRLIPLFPMIVTRRVGPFAALRESWDITQGAFWRILGAVLVYLFGSMVVMLALSTGVGAVLALLAQAAGAPDLGKVLIAVFLRGIAALAGLGFHVLIAGIFRQLNDGPIRGA